jgi:hypothetical protein
VLAFVEMLWKSSAVERSELNISSGHAAVNKSAVLLPFEILTF